MQKMTAGYIPWWVLLSAVALVSTCALSVAGYAWLTRPASLPLNAVTTTAEFNVIAALPNVPTATQQMSPTMAPDTPTPPLPTPPPGTLAVGGYVQVVGTGATGFLNLRAEAGLENAVNYLAIEREILQVQAGPIQADGFTWWYLVDPATQSKFGWGVQNFLQVVQSP